MDGMERWYIANFAPAPAGWRVLFSGSEWEGDEPPWQQPLAGWVTLEHPDEHSRIIPAWLDGSEVTWVATDLEQIRILGPDEDDDTPAIREWHAHHAGGRS